MYAREGEKLKLVVNAIMRGFLGIKYNFLCFFDKKMRGNIKKIAEKLGSFK